VRNPEGKDGLEHQGLDGTKIKKSSFKKWDEAVWTGWIWLRIGTDGGLL
jgi:hypothetical protein